MEKEAIVAIEKAIWNHDLELIKKLLDQKPPELCSKALRIAAVSGSNNIMSVIDYYGADGYDAEAVRVIEEQNKELVKLILSCGADVNVILKDFLNHRIYNSFGRRTYYTCSFTSAEFLIKVITGDRTDLTPKDVVERIPVQVAFQSGEEDLISAFLERGVNAEEINRLHLLHRYITSCSPQEQMITRLLKLGADVNGIDEERHTVLSLAVLISDVPIVKLLIRNGASVNGFNDKLNVSELKFAMQCGKIEIVEILLDNGAAQENDVLRDAICDHDIGLVKLLLNHGYDANCLTEGNTTLYWAIIKTRTEMVKLLLEYGAKPNVLIPNSANDYYNYEYYDYYYYEYYWMYALHLAAFQGSQEMFELLLDYGADINLDDNGMTALEVALNVLDLKACELVIMQMALMQSQGLYVSPLNLNLVARHEETEAYQVKCADELKVLKKEKFDGSFLSYFDILKGIDVREWACLARNESIQKVVKSIDFKEKFPVYAEMLVKNFDKGISKGILRNKNFELIKKFINYLWTRNHDQLPRLPFAVVRELFTYLSDEDVATLRNI